MAVTPKPANDPAPNYERLQCRGQIKIGANVSVSLQTMHLDWGKWGTNPPSSLTGPSSANWMAQGRLSSASGTEGYIVYTTSDNASFKLYFDVPYSGSNKAQFTCNGQGCSLYSYSVTPVSESGDVIEPIYEINRK